MADTIKILGQSYPVVGVLTDAYTAPSAATVSSIFVCNQNVLESKFRISIAQAGAADTSQQYLYYDEVIQAKETFVATVGITLASTDVVRVYSANGLCSFNIFGVEVV